MPEILIRPASPADADELFMLAGKLATSAVVERGAFEAVLAEIVADARQRLLVAELDGRLVGYVHALVHPAFHANGNVSWIEEIHVDGDLARTGLGRRLMTAVEEWAETGAQVTYHSVATRRAEPFYRAVGYEASATWFKKTARGAPGDRRQDSVG